MWYTIKIETKNLVLSEQYQDLIDQMSDSDESDYGDESIESEIGNEQEYDAFDYLEES